LNLTEDGLNPSDDSSSIAPSVPLASKLWLFHAAVENDVSAENDHSPIAYVRSRLVLRSSENGPGSIVAVTHHTPERLESPCAANTHPEQSNTTAASHTPPLFTRLLANLPVSVIECPNPAAFYSLSLMRGCV